MDQKQQIRAVVLKHLRANVEGLEDGEIDTSKPITDYGATSLDIVEVVMSAMSELNLSVPRTQLAGVENIDEIVELFVRLQGQGA